MGDVHKLSPREKAKFISAFEKAGGTCELAYILMRDKNAAQDVVDALKGYREEKPARIPDRLVATRPAAKQRPLAPERQVDTGLYQR